MTLTGLALARVCTMNGKLGMSIYHCPNLGAEASGAPPSKFDCDGIVGKNSITNKYWYCPRLATYFTHLHSDLMKLISGSSSMNGKQNKTSFLVQLAFAAQKTPTPYATLWGWLLHDPLFIRKYSILPVPQSISL